MPDGLGGGNGVAPGTIGGAAAHAVVVPSPTGLFSTRLTSLGFPSAGRASAGELGSADLGGTATPSSRKCGRGTGLGTSLVEADGWRPM